MQERQDAGLNQDALGLGEAIVMGVAGTAPAFSIAATMATLVAAVGVLAPASLLYCGLVMFGVAFAFLHLTRIDPSAGSAYAWVRRAFHPVLGFFAGWTMLVMGAVFMVSGTIPVATATLSLAAPALVDNKTAVTLVAAAWVLVVMGIVLKGIKMSSYVQVVMTVVEIAIVVLILVLAIGSGFQAPVHALTMPVLLGGGFTPGLFTAGALVAVFFFGGWDVTANLNEETRQPARNAGPAAVVAMLVLLVLFTASAIACLFVLDDKEIQDAGTNVLTVLAQKVLPSPYSYIAAIAVILSTIGTLETTFLQFSRMMFAMARDGNFPPRYARLHARHRTPWGATLIVTGIGLVLLFLSTYLPSINTIMKDSVNAIGLQVSFYYGIGCAACVWDMRRDRSLYGIATGIAWPLLSAVFLLGIAVFSIPTLDALTITVGAGAIGVGIIPLAWRILQGKRTS